MVTVGGIYIIANTKFNMVCMYVYIYIIIYISYEHIQSTLYVRCTPAYVREFIGDISVRPLALRKYHK